MVLRRTVSLVTALCAFAISALADVGGRFEVDIRLRVDPSIASRRITDRLKSEVEAIWGPYGIGLEWTDADDSESPRNSVSLEASVERQFERRQRTGWPAALGLAAVEPGAPIWRPIRVSVDATERALAGRSMGRYSIPGVVLDPELARALGRVLAHEIGHVLLGPPYHDRAGLMRASFRPDELGEPDRTPFRLTCGEVDRLGSRLRALTGDQALEHHDHSTTLDLEGARGTRRESSVETSCIRTQSAH